MLGAIPISALLLDTIVPYYLSLAVGTFADNDKVAMASYLWWASGFVLLGVSLNIVGFQSAVRHEALVRRRLATSTLDHLLAKDHDFFANQKIGGLTGKYIDFINAHVSLQDLFILRTLAFVINLVVGVGIIFSQTPLLAWIIIGLLVGLVVQIRYSRILREKIRAERKRLVGEVNGAVADTLTNYLTVKTFAKEKEEIAQTDELSSQYQRAYQKDFMWLSIEGSGRILFMQSIQIIAIIVIATLLMNGSVTLAIAIFTVAYLQRLAAQLFNLGELINGYDRVLLQATPMTDILLEDARIVDHANTTLRVTEGEIVFDNVTYAYVDDKTTRVLQGMSLTIPAGQKIGIVGVSGAGKTTITKLLLRFDDIDDGKIMIDGQPIDRVSQRSLREAISYVPQEPMLFHRTLRENIAYGRPKASEDEIIDSATKAHAMEFIAHLPDGLDTIVGERGVKLSGGQRQRIAIARAILKDAPILVLDEATSALDSESEKLIQRSLHDLMKDRTSIVIAHRLSTISKLDRIIVLDNGAIVEDGTHTELIAKNGIYASLWAHQSGGFIEEK